MADEDFMDMDVDSVGCVAFAHSLSDAGLMQRALTNDLRGKSLLRSFSSALLIYSLPISFPSSPSSPSSPPPSRCQALDLMSLTLSKFWSQWSSDFARSTLWHSSRLRFYRRRVAIRQGLWALPWQAYWRDCRWLCNGPRFVHLLPPTLPDSPLIS